MHFGGKRKCTQLLNNVNERLEANNLPTYFPTSENSKDVDLNMVYDERGYDLPKFDVINTGIINCRDYADSDIYQKQLIECSKNGRDGIINFITEVHPDFNDREVFFLAERAEFGKGKLHELNELLTERERNRNKDEHSQTYISMLESVRHQDVRERNKVEKMEKEAIEKDKGAR